MPFGMTERLPLFPLDIVLFPGMVLPLHIFEPRYRQMVEDCQRTDGDFGLLWAEGEPLSLGADEELIGTRATINGLDTLPDGRYTFKAVGLERFRVRALSYDQPYLVGEILPFPLADLDSPRVRPLVDTLRPLFARYLAQLTLLVGQSVRISPWPESPESVAFLVAVMYQAQNYRKQELLAIESLPALLAREIELLRIENPILGRQLEMQARPGRDEGDDEPLLWLN